MELRTIKECSVIECFGASEFREEIDDHLKNGWFMYGNHQMNDRRMYSIIMVKYDD